MVIDSGAQNVSQARNEGLKAATGEIIGFCDADDYFESSVLNVFVEKMKDADMLAFGFKRVDDKGNSSFGHPLSEGMKSVNRVRCDIINNPSMLGSVCNKFYKKLLLENIFFDEHITHCEDMDFNLRVLKNNHIKVLYSGVTGYNYVYSASSATNDRNSIFDEKNKLRYLYSMEKISNEYAENKRVQKEIGFKMATLCIDNFSNDLDSLRKQGLTINIRNNIKYLWMYLFKYEPRENILRLKKALGIIRK